MESCVLLRSLSTGGTCHESDVQNKTCRCEIKGSEAGSRVQGGLAQGTSLCCDSVIARH